MLGVVYTQPPHPQDSSRQPSFSLFIFFFTAAFNKEANDKIAH